MTLDLTHLRALAVDYQRALNLSHGVLDDAQSDAFMRLIQALSPDALLELLDRLERAEKKLAERDTVYPTLMTQVGKEKT